MRADSREAFGGFLDEWPKALYVLVHVVMLGVGIALWAHATNTGFPHPSGLLLYVVSQVFFLAFFAGWITLKMAVLVEQMLILAMMCAITLGMF